jgi:hypothetical protein
MMKAGIQFFSIHSGKIDGHQRLTRIALPQWTGQAHLNPDAGKTLNNVIKLHPNQIRRLFNNCA